MATATAQARSTTTPPAAIELRLADTVQRPGLQPVTPAGSDVAIYISSSAIANASDIAGADEHAESGSPSNSISSPTLNEKVSEQPSRRRADGDSDRQPGRVGAGSGRASVPTFVSVGLLQSRKFPTLPQRWRLFREEPGRGRLSV